MKIGIVGLGLLGGSVALAAKQNGATVLAYDIRSQIVEQAVAENIVDVGASAVTALADADIILIAVPVLAMPDVIADLLPVLHDKHIITDVGSTKLRLTEELRRLMKDGVRRFVFAHPVAGSEKSGLAAARADLFVGKKTVLCDTENSDADAVAAVQALWRSFGATTLAMSSDEHDDIFALVSHLPHALAYTLVGMIGDNDKRETMMRHTAGGFRDFTRIAGSDPAMWRDICLTNKGPLLTAIHGYQQCLAQLAKEIENADADALFERFDISRRLRRELLTIQGKNDL